MRCSLSALLVLLLVATPAAQAYTVGDAVDKLALAAKRSVCVDADSLTVGFGASCPHGSLVWDAVWGKLDDVESSNCDVDPDSELAPVGAALCPVRLLREAWDSPCALDPAGVCETEVPTFRDVKEPVLLLCGLLGLGAEEGGAPGCLEGVPPLP